MSNKSEKEVRSGLIERQPQGGGWVGVGGWGGRERDTLTSSIIAISIRNVSYFLGFPCLFKYFFMFQL